MPQTSQGKSYSACYRRMNLPLAVRLLTGLKGLELLQHKYAVALLSSMS